jgi:dihydropteroate synthase
MLSLEHLAQLLANHPVEAQAVTREFAIGASRFGGAGHPGIMGVVNLSPDSWYRESVCLSADQAIQRGCVLRAQGADIIDLGAESTLHQASRTTAPEQLKRMLPVLSELAAAKIPVSVETYEIAVARQSLEAGASVLNLTGTQQTEEIYRMVADHDAAVIICYVQGEHVREVGDFDFAADPIVPLTEFFARQVSLATAAGVQKIFLDPGLGFYYRNLQDSTQRVRHQMNVFLNTFRLRKLGWPVCHALPHAFEFFGEEVRSAEPFFAVLAALGKTELFRTHEVTRVAAVLKTLGSF